ncbi:MAG: pyruvate dehydrogenase complex E1 component subunit beta [Armatimonadota bacterium]|nr:pyruvate dehydrogenase complex E1 component subunit beta [Armatimonadota bacterium]
MAQMTYRQALNQAMREEMRRDPDVFLIGEEVAEYEGAYKVSEGLLQEFGPKRVVDTPISEEAIAGTGIGAAMVGLRPIVEMMTINFTLLAMDQLVNHAAKLRYMSGGQLKIPLTLRAPQGAGMQLGAQHSQNLESWFIHVPGLKVVAPSTPYDAKGLLKSAIRDDNPVIFLEHELLYGVKGEVPDEEYIIPLGAADVKRAGTDVTIVCYLRMVSVALKAAEALEAQGISAEIVDLRTLKPMDTDTLVNSLKKTHRLVMVEEDYKSCGTGAEVVALMQELAFDYLDAPMERVATAEVPMPYAKNLEKAAIPSEQSVIDAVYRTLARETYQLTRV